MASSKIPSYQPKGKYVLIGDDTQTDDIFIESINNWTHKIGIGSSNGNCHLYIGNCHILFSYDESKIVVTTPKGTKSVNLS